MEIEKTSNINIEFVEKINFLMKKCDKYINTCYFSYYYYTIDKLFKLHYCFDKKFKNDIEYYDNLINNSEFKKYALSQSIKCGIVQRELNDLCMHVMHDENKKIIFECLKCINACYIFDEKMYMIVHTKVDSYIYNLFYIHFIIMAALIFPNWYEHKKKYRKDINQYNMVMMKYNKFYKFNTYTGYVFIHNALNDLICDEKSMNLKFIIKLMENFIARYKNVL